MNDLFPGFKDTFDFGSLDKRLLVNGDLPQVPGSLRLLPLHEALARTRVSLQELLASLLFVPLLGIQLFDLLLDLAVISPQLLPASPRFSYLSLDLVIEHLQLLLHVLGLLVVQFRSEFLLLLYCSAFQELHSVLLEVDTRFGD